MCGVRLLWGWWEHVELVWRRQGRLSSTGGVAIGPSCPPLPPPNRPHIGALPSLHPTVPTLEPWPDFYTTPLSPQQTAPVMG